MSNRQKTELRHRTMRLKKYLPVYRLSHYFVDRLRRGTIERFMRLCFAALDFDVA